ncbi:MAG TPA: thermonuclease family protein [Vicinamibacteria bacterium]
MFAHAFLFLTLLQAPAPPPAESSPAVPAAPRAAPSPQPRPSGVRVPVPVQLVSVDDGDTVQIRWPQGDLEIVRLLGIDTPETRHVEHDIPFDQSFGKEARAFAQGAFAAATQIELLRSKTLDPFGRTLGYAFVNGVNYSLLVVKARLAEESVSRYGDNGLPKEAAEVLAAAKAAGPLPFEPPGAYRTRMREVTKAMKARGEYPAH